MQSTIIAIVIFAIVFLVIQTCIFAYKSIRYPNRNKIKRRLEALSSGQYDASITDIRKKRTLSKIPLLDKLLAGASIVNRFETLVRQADSKYPVGFFLLLIAVLALSGYVFALLLWKNQVIAIFLAALLGCAPIFYLRLKKKKRIEKFEAQLPEALDLIARALRAGHAFGSGMKMVAEEFGDPLGAEFRMTLEEIHYGAGTEDALKSLTQRVDCPDLKYFVVSVILQRETGGNLAEIIESIAYIIRERFKLQGKIRVLTAESRFSALILTLLPFIAVIAMQFVNPDYISTLLSTELGRISIAIALGMMFIGILVMKRIIKIRV